MKLHFEYNWLLKSKTKNWRCEVYWHEYIYKRNTFHIESGYIGHNEQCLYPFCNFMSNQFYIISNLFLIRINSKKCSHERLKFDNDQRLINLDRFPYYSFAHVTSIQEVSMVRNCKIVNVCFIYWSQMYYRKKCHCSPVFIFRRNISKGIPL